MPALPALRWIERLALRPRDLVGRVDALVPLAPRASGPVIATAVIVAVALLIVEWAWLVPTGALQSLSAATGGVVSGTLVLNALNGAVVLGGVVFGLGRVRPADLGLSLRKLWIGGAITIAIWSSTQAAVAASAWLSASRLDGAALPAEPLTLFGRVLGQALGTAPVEELLFRAFLPIQLYAWLRARDRAPWTALLIATLASQALFALSHMPQRLYYDVAGPDLWISLAVVASSGLFALLVYVRTHNIFLVMGLHALANEPVPLWNAPLDPLAVHSAAALLLLLLWPQDRREADLAGDDTEKTPPKGSK